MDQLVSIPSGLYPQVLGSSWSELDAIVRQFHSEGEIVHAVGTFRIEHGSNRFSRFLAWMGRLPAAGEVVDLRLIVTPMRDGEEWRRSFAGRLLVSKQWRRPDGLLAEHMGLLELRFRIEVIDSSLHYHTQRAALRLGPFCLPLLRWMAPCVTASEKPSDNGTIHVKVEARLPLLGRLISYEGTVTRVPLT